MQHNVSAQRAPIVIRNANSNLESRAGTPRMASAMLRNRIQLNQLGNKWQIIKSLDFDLDSVKSVAEGLFGAVIVSHCDKPFDTPLADWRRNAPRLVSLQPLCARTHPFVVFRQDVLAAK